MLKRLFSFALMGFFLTGCASSGFAVATKDNTDRVNTYQDNILLQAANNMEAINACYLRASGYAPVVGTANGLVKLGEPSGASECTVLAMGLQTQSNMMTMFAPYVAQALMGRVPAAPEEIVQSLLKDGMKFALTKFGINAVTDVVKSGQFAQAQIATQGIEAAAKPPLIIEVAAPTAP